MTDSVIIGNATLFQGDCLEVLATMPDNSVHCCVTSPPYFGLRDYGHPDQIGLEASPEAYVTKMVSVFREVRRVLRDDGCCFINIGDSYAGSGVAGPPSAKNKLNNGVGAVQNNKVMNGLGRAPTAPGYKPKDLIGIPWMLAFALRADGWYLRSEIIWAKKNCMPESVTDRPTKAHEQVFLLTKSARYWYDAEAVKEKSIDPEGSAKRYESPFWENGKHQTGGYSANGAKHTAGIKQFDSHRNRRSVWSIASQPFPGAHFAVMPKKLVEPCIMAGCPVGGIVLDPFNGAATVGIVALEHGRQYLGIELNPEYVQLSVDRLRDATRQGQLFTLPPDHLPPVPTPTDSQASLLGEAV